MADRATQPVAPATADASGAAGASAVTPIDQPGAQRTTGRFRRRYSLLTGRDKLVLGLMVGIPLVLDLVFIWGPTIVSFFLSFTNWNGIGSPFDAEGHRDHELREPVHRVPVLLARAVRTT